jgi:CTP:molybdopterin cytidylyltransferase MocA
MEGRRPVRFVGGVLAAGKGLRLLGRHKPFIWWRGAFLIEHAVQVFQDAGAEHVILVLRPEHHRVLDQVRSLRIGQRSGCVSVVYPHHDGLAGSVQAVYGAFESLCSCVSDSFESSRGQGSLVLHQVDRPFVSARQIRQLIEAPQQSASYSDGDSMVPPVKLPCGMAKVVACLTGDTGLGGLARLNLWRPDAMMSPEPGDVGPNEDLFFHDIDTPRDALSLLQIGQ